MLDFNFNFENFKWIWGDSLNKKLPSYQYGDSRYKDRQSRLYNGNPYTRKDCLDTEMGLWVPIKGSPC